MSSKSLTPRGVVVKDVSFGYQRPQQILDNWSAEFAEGSMTALTGPSGRGKSTLLYLLGLMLRPTRGEIIVAGRSSSSLRDSERASLRARHFGFVFQDAALDPARTVIDNITETALYRRQRRRPLERDAVQLMERFGVDVPANRTPGQVSGGQAQRIALCRALLGSPSILLADEPTGNLDPITSELVISALREHAHAGSTVIVVTHSPGVAEASDREIKL